MVSGETLAERIYRLTRGQRDIWLAQGTGSFGVKWQLGELLRIEGALDPDLVERAIVQAVRDAEPLRAAFFEVDDQVLQTPLDYPNVSVPCYDLTGSPDPARDAHRLASSIQLEPMSLDGPLFRFALFQTRVDEFHLFACCHHIVVDGIGLALVIHRIADVYSALVSDVAIPPSHFGTLKDLIESESEYEASADYSLTRRTGLEIFRRKANPATGWRWASLMTRHLHRFSWPLRLWFGSTSCRRRWGYGDRR